MPTSTGTVIITDSACDLPQVWLDEHHVVMVPLNINFDDGSFTDRQDIDNAAFFAKLARAAHPPKTAQPAPGAFVRVFDAAAAEGANILCLTMSARMSGTHGSAQIAAGMTSADVLLVDSEAMSVLLGAQVRGAVEVLQGGGGREAATAEAARIRRDQELLFTVPDLVALREGGRIGRAAALLGGVLQVRPILTMRDGEVEVQSRVRTNARARDAIVERLSQRVAERGKKASVMVAAADDPTLVEDLAVRVEPYADEVTRIEIGPVIAAHTGAGTGGIGYHFS
jgi:DegV family protein with EDD domain